MARMLIAWMAMLTIYQDEAPGQYDRGYLFEEMKENFAAVWFASEERGYDPIDFVAASWRENRLRDDMRGPICGPMQVNHKFVDYTCTELNKPYIAATAGIDVYEYFNEPGNCRGIARSDYSTWCCYNEGHTCRSRGRSYVRDIKDISNEIRTRSNDLARLFGISFSQRDKD